MMGPSRDFGGLVTRTPSRVLAPTSVDDLCMMVAELAAARTAFIVRGAAHTAGGQTVTDGVVIDTRSLGRILEDHPERDELVVEGGALWLDVVRHLYPQERRPTALTDNLRTTVGGTLALGGFGDTSHRLGLQIAGVTALVVVTPDGRRVACRPGEELFASSLAGGGRSGILAAITLRTIRRPPQITGRVITWPTLDAFVFDRATLRAYEYVRARVYFASDGAQRVVGLVGAFGVELPVPDPMLSLVGSDASQTDTIDLAALAEVDPTLTWPRFSPCLELTFSIPDGLAIWSRLHAALHARGLLRHLPDGASVMVVAGDPVFPHAPLGVGDNLLVALRPGFADEATARAVAAELDALGAEAIRDGARRYPVG